MVINITESGLPNFAKVVFTYPDVKVLGDGAAVQDHNSYRANSIFDPDFTATGVQPPMRDFWAQAYAFYRVDKCVVKVTFLNTAETAPTFGYIYADDDNDDDTAIVEDIIPTNIQGINSVIIPASGSGMSGAPHTISLTIFPKRVNPHMIDQEEWTPFNENPATEVQAHIGVISAVSSAIATGAVTALMHITYHCTLAGRIIEMQRDID